MPELFYLNGSIVAPEDAKISVLDRGFLFGDGLYEVFRVYDNKPYCFEEHLDRLFFGVEGIKMPFPHTRDEFRAILLDLVRKSNLGGASVYLEVTRGAYNPRTHYITDQMTKPTIFIQTRAMGPQPEEPRTSGTDAPLVKDIRWMKCCYKTVNLLGNCMAMTVAHDAGVPEVVMYRDENHVTECSASTFFIVKDGEVWTHPLNDLILPGITRIVLKRMCEAEGIPFVERIFGLADMYSAQEAFFGNSILEVVPITSVGGKPIGTGKPGPVTKKLIDLYLKDTGQK